MNYRAAYAIVKAFAESWRRKRYPYEKDETLPCPACAGNLHMVQTSTGTSANTLGVHCSNAFCVQYQE